MKFRLNLAAKSSSAYKDLRYDSTTASDLIVLPGLRTLRHYKNYVKPTRGFNPQAINDLEKKTACFSEVERYLTILLNEIKLQYPVRPIAGNVQGTASKLNELITESLPIKKRWSLCFSR